MLFKEESVVHAILVIHGGCFPTYRHVFRKRRKQKSITIAIFMLKWCQNCLMLNICVTYPDKLGEVSTQVTVFIKSTGVSRQVSPVSVLDFCVGNY